MAAIYDGDWETSVSVERGDRGAEDVEGVRFSMVGRGNPSSLVGIWQRGRVSAPAKFFDFLSSKRQVLVHTSCYFCS